jgi:hypothetical protein
LISLKSAVFPRVVVGAVAYFFGHGRIADNCRMVSDLSHMTSKISAGNRRGQKAQRAAWLLAIFTGVVAVFAPTLVAAAFLTIREARGASSEQLGVRTWLYVEQHCDSDELTATRKKLAQELDPYDPKRRSEIGDDISNFSSRSARCITARCSTGNSRSLLLHL